MMMLDRINVLNKFSFGPSQEDEGRKKTAHAMDGTHLAKYHVCPIHAEPLHDNRILRCLPLAKLL